MKPDQDELKLPGLKVVDWIILVVLISVLIIAGVVLYQNLHAQDLVYGRVIEHALKIGDAQANSAVLAFSRARDFANMKAASMFVGFLLIFTGALFLLKVFGLAYKLTADKTPVGSFGLESSSPGLVMITLGVAIMVVVLVTKTQVDYETIREANLQPALAKLDSLEKILNKPGAPETTVSTSKKIRKPVISDNFFLPGRNAPYQRTVDELVRRLKADPSLKIKLVPQLNEGNAATNMRIARDMVTKIKLLLVNAGISQERIKVTSFGETRPIAESIAQKEGITITIEK